ncbi:MAG: ABC transporter ATP-binding protein [Rickettsiales bacterium]|jgi:putative ABC transport system ATP-binding protein|nr:ABC transporter ATP-binding protein [Rickettsiales bacterium]
MEEVIRVENINKTYFSVGGFTSQSVLKNINLRVHRGDFMSVMGQSGSGKSTLMNILGCLDTPTSGDYYLNGRNVSKMTGDELANVRNRYIGFVFQSFNLLPRRTVFDNVAIPMIYSDCSRREKKERIEDLLRSVKLESYMEYYPTQLSGGMQQRVAIARALVNGPSVIFADEPTGNLDVKTSSEIMDTFRNMNEKMGITIVMVTHEPSIASCTKRLVYIRDGHKEHDCAMEEAIEKNIIRL